MKIPLKTLEKPATVVYNIHMEIQPIKEETVMSYVQDLSNLVEARKDATIRISDAVWEYAESRF